MAIELIAKIKQKNGGTFKLVDACDVELSNGQDLQSFLDNLSEGVIPPSGGDAPTNTKCYVHTYEEELTEEVINEHEIFIDKRAESTLQGAINNISSAFMEEIRGMFKSLQKTIDEQQAKIIDLEARVRYLESLENIVTPEISSILLENGGSLLLESGYKLLLENSSAPINTTKRFLLEDGGLFLLENGNKLLLEDSAIENINSTQRLLLENGGLFRLENGGLLYLENSVVAPNKTISRLLKEDGGFILLEDGSRLYLEGSYIGLENGKAVLKLENGEDLLLENGGNIVLELSEEEYALLLESGAYLLNENGENINLEKQGVV